MRYSVAKLIVNLIEHSYKCAGCKLSMADVKEIIAYVEDQFDNRPFDI